MYHVRYLEKKTTANPKTKIRAGGNSNFEIVKLSNFYIKKIATHSHAGPIRPVPRSQVHISYN